MNKKTVLLTGATGFLGSCLLKAMLGKGHRVVILKRETSDLSRICDLLDQIKFYDIETVQLGQIFNEHTFDFVVHTACCYGRNNQTISEIVEANFLLGLKLFEAAKLHDVPTFVNTDTLLPKYVSEYSLSKKQLTEWLLRFNDKMQVVNFKIEHMYGPGDDSSKFVPWLIGQFKQNVVRVPLTAGLQKRDFIYIDDVVSAYMLLLEKAHELDTCIELDVGTGVLRTVRDFVENLHHEYQRKFPDNNSVLGFGDIPVRDGELLSVDVDNSTLKKLGWQTVVPVATGIKNLFKD